MARVSHHNIYNDLDVEANPNISRNRSKAVPESNGLVPHHDKFGSGEPTKADLYRMLEENLDRQSVGLRATLTDKIKHWVNLRRRWERRVSV